MDKKVVLITGGSSGIGKAIGVYLMEKGFVVYGTTRNPENYPDFDAFSLIALEVMDADTIAAGVAEVISREGRLDILINNAGVGITGAVEETPVAEVNKVFDINFNGPIRMIQAVLPQMRKQGAGLIINITSIAGYMGLPFRGIYSATKGALELLTEALRMEVKDFGVKVVNVAPGDFATNIASGRYHVPVHEDSAYPKYGESLQLMNEHVSTAGDPKAVAEKVFSIIGKTNPKTHYKVGTAMQRFSIVLKKILPDKRYESLLLKHYKL